MMSGTKKFDGSSMTAKNLNNFSFPAGEKDGLKWEWKVTSGLSINSSTGKLEEYVFLSWKFDWEEMNGYEGTITAKWLNRNYDLLSAIFEVDLCRCGEWIQKQITTLADANNHKTFCFNFELTPVQKTKGIVVLESIFAKSESTDVSFIVEDKKIHVNKAILSYHSEFFRALFSSDFKEKSMGEIPIEDVKFEHFAALLSLLSTTPIWPTEDEIVEILKLSDRFLMPMPKSYCENVLLKSEHLKFEEKMVLVEPFRLEKLMRKCIRDIVSIDDVKKIAKVVDFKNLSESFKAKILERCLEN